MNQGFRGATAVAVAAMLTALQPTCAAAQAAPPPVDAPPPEALDLGARALEAVNQMIQRPPAPLAAPTEDGALPIPEAAETQPVPIAAVRFLGRDGAPLAPGQGLPLDALNAAAAGLVGPDATAADVIRAHDRMKAALREEGFLFTSIADPQLTVAEDGRAYIAAFRILGITVTEAVPVLAEAGEDPDAAPPAVFAQIEKILRPLQGKANPTLADLERVSLLATDLPGVVRATFVPAGGAEPGQLKLFLNVEFRPVSGVFFADNRQSPALGPVLFGAVASVNSWNSMAATTEVAAFNSAAPFSGELGLDQRHTLRVAQRFFFGETSDKLEIYGLWSQSSPGDFLERLELESEEVKLGFLYERPMVRTRPYSFWIGAGAEWRNATTEDRSGIFADDTVTALVASARMERRHESGYTRLQAEGRVGLDLFGATGGDDVDKSRDDADGTFVLARVAATQVQELANDFSLLGRAMVQWTPEPLLSGEQLSAGGALFGKGYDPSEISGDYGAMVYAELRHDISTDIDGIPLDLQFYAFGDYAEIYRIDDDTEFGEQSRSSIGAGVRIGYEGAELTLEAAQPVSDPLGRTADKNPRFFFSLIKRF
ncbi:ShlB/FhaC/HecB family hemolysin secretion/activation protein [Rhodovulum sp. DZ06]|uniref:ShlB/FhaC/HecB family hemolysin secretion/activation protein n=1 Tax=Rhodovulum sp. DZ06 TaxID=3425126 RepID=UPI003D329650